IQQIMEKLRIEPRLRLGTLAVLVNLSPSRLQHLFKEHTGVRIGIYAKEIQLQRARQLLLETLKPLKVIGEDIGIPDTANLSRHFKHRFGYTPRGYRRLFKEQQQF